MNALQIDKELISKLRFPKTDVLKTIDAKKIRKMTLSRASILGNLDRTKMLILFKDSNGLKKVYTTIWAVTKKHVILKGARTIPLNRIIDVY